MGARPIKFDCRGREELARLKKACKELGIEIVREDEDARVLYLDAWQYLPHDHLFMNGGKYEQLGIPHRRY